MIAPVTRSKQHMDSPSRVRNSFDPQVAVPAQNPQQDLRLERLPTPDRETSSTRTERRPVTKEALATTTEYSKPAIALAGPVHSKIVVVSAEQAQRERERAARSAVQHPRVPAIGLTGRAAFEALFNDGSDASKTTRE